MLVKGWFKLKEKKIKPHKSDDISKLKDLSEILTQYNLTAVEISENEKKYRVEKDPGAKTDSILQGEVPLKSDEESNKLPKRSELIQSENADLETIKSPMVGIFYANSSPGQGSLVKAGQIFKEGDVLCVIEAMKTFTEIRADVSGTIKEVCATNGDLVEYSQPLFKYVKQ